MTQMCQYCRENEAVTMCDVCGTLVCRECKLEYGCKACEGGIQKV